MLGSPDVPIVIALAASLIAAITDIWKFKVYNLLTFPLLVGGVVYHAIYADLGSSLLGVLFGFGSLIALHIVGGMGAGDVKLMAALGAWLGMPLTFYVFIGSSLAAGVYAVVLMVATGKVGETVVNLHVLWMRLKCIGRYLGADDRVEKEVRRDNRRRRIIPFAAMVLVGIIGTLLWFGKDLAR